MAASLTLNERAQRLADHLAANAASFRIQARQSGSGARILDFGVQAVGGLQAGLALARVCLAGLADVSVAPGEIAGMPGLSVAVTTDQPVAACMASQYAGWQITVGDFFAMGSGPMRAAYGGEELYNKISGREQPPLAVGVLESRGLPGDDVIAYLCERLGLPAAKLTLLVAPAASLAGTIKVVARSLETALHKLYELGFDLNQVVSGFGSAPLPPVAARDLQAIGRTNDAILYGGQVVLWVRAEDDQLAELGPKVPSCASPDHGAPFSAIFERYHRDFYQIDPMLFSPARIVFHNMNSGQSQAFGRVEPKVLEHSFFAGPHVG